MVPCLHCTLEVVRGQPNSIRGEGTLPPEKLLTKGEPMQEVLHAIVGGEVKLAKARNAQIHRGRWGWWRWGVLREQQPSRCPREFRQRRWRVGKIDPMDGKASGGGSGGRGGGRSYSSRSGGGGNGLQRNRAESWHPVEKTLGQGAHGRGRLMAFHGSQA